jgi:Ser/Thr protein kinase RdoA (MazF antagonist)
MLRNQQPEHYRQLGRLTAMLHEHARSWTRPPGFTRPTWNTAGLLGRRPNLVDVDDAWALVPSEYRPLLEEVTERFTDATDRLGRSPDAFGLIHSDLHLENVVFACGSARPIDFDDCGFGWYVYDLSAAAQLFPPFPDAAGHREAFIAGYREIRPLDDARLRFLGVMRAARLAGLALWLINRAPTNAAIRTALGGWIESGRLQIESLLKE